MTYYYLQLVFNCIDCHLLETDLQIHSIFRNYLTKIDLYFLETDLKYLHLIFLEIIFYKILLKTRFNKNLMDLAKWSKLKTLKLAVKPTRTSDKQLMLTLFTGIRSSPKG
jgi:hypothetical protein